MTGANRVAPPAWHWEEPEGRSLREILRPFGRIVVSDEEFFDEFEGESCKKIKSYILVSGLERTDLSVLYE